MWIYVINVNCVIYVINYVITVNLRINVIRVSFYNIFLPKYTWDSVLNGEIIKFWKRSYEVR